MMKCYMCGQIFEDDLLDEIIDRDTRETFGVCPYCGSDEIETVKECAVCGEYFQEDELHGSRRSVCLGCVAKRRHDVDFCKAVGDEEQVQVFANSFLLNMFDDNEIEEILLRELHERNKVKEVDCMPYLIEFIDTAADHIVEE